MKIGEQAIESGYLNPLQVRIALSSQGIQNAKSPGDRKLLGACFIELKMMSEDRLSKLVDEIKGASKKQIPSKSSSDAVSNKAARWVQIIAGIVLLVMFTVSLSIRQDIEFSAMVLGVGSGLWAAICMVGKLRPESKLGLYYINPLLIGILIISFGFIVGSALRIYSHNTIPYEPGSTGLGKDLFVLLLGVLAILVILFCASCAAFTRRHKEIHWKAQLLAHSAIQGAAANAKSDEDYREVMNLASCSLSQHRYGTAFPEWSPIRLVPRKITAVYFEPRGDHFVPMLEGYGAGVSDDLRNSLAQLYKICRPKQLDVQAYINSIRKHSKSSGVDSPTEWMKNMQAETYLLSEGGEPICSLTGFCYHYNISKCALSIDSCLAFDRAFLAKCEKDRSLSLAARHLRGASVFAHPVVKSGDEGGVAGVLMVFMGKNGKFLECDGAGIALLASALARKIAAK